MRQTEQILHHMERYGSITALEAMQEYGCMRLGARVWDLRQDGHRILREMVEGRNRFGDTTRFARYRLAE